MARIVFFETEEGQKEIINKALNGQEIVFRTDKLTSQNVSVVKEAEIISGLIWSEFPKAVLDMLPNLKLIATRSTGFDHIDLNFCREKNIVVSNVPSYGEHTIAEHTFALMLSISRNIIESVERTKKGDFRLNDLRGFDLNGKTLGVVGAGHIGKKVIELAHCFGMKILVFTRTQDPKLVEEHGVEYVTLDKLLSLSDIITIHVPHTEETHHLINTKNISFIKKGAILINTARGAVVETQAIIEGIEKGIFAKVGLDVLEEECMMKEESELLSEEFLKKCDLKTQLLNHVLLNKREVIITPHNAFNSNEAIHQILKVTLDNISSFLSGKPQNDVRR